MFKSYQSYCWGFVLGAACLDGLVVYSVWFRTGSVSVWGADLVSSRWVFYCRDKLLAKTSSPSTLTVSVCETREPVYPYSPSLVVFFFIPWIGGNSPCLSLFFLLTDDKSVCISYFFSFLTFFITLTCSLNSCFISLTDIWPCDSNSFFANLKFSSSIFWDSFFLATMFRDLGLKIIEVEETLWLMGVRVSTLNCKGESACER